MRNRFFIWELYADEPQEFRPEEALGPGVNPDYRYFLGVCHEVDRRLGDQGITFLLTWHLDRFQERFRDSVVLLINDEQYQCPSYAGQVMAVFKTGGGKRNPISNTLSLAPAIASRTVLRELRNLGLTVQRRMKYRQTRGAPIFELPLGFFRLEDVPDVPFADRTTDVFFAGSVERLKGFTVRPRLAARRQMAAALDDARRQLPDLRVDYSSGGPFVNPDEMLAPGSYSTRLMAARIVLCPRGNFDETYRLMESARCGCVAITERLPERWYLEGTPAIQLHRWSELPQTLERLLADPDGLEERAEQMRRWWTSTLSEEAISRFVVSSMPRTTPAVEPLTPSGANAESP